MMRKFLAIFNIGYFFAEVSKFIENSGLDRSFRSMIGIRSIQIEKIATVCFALKTNERFDSNFIIIFAPPQPALVTLAGVSITTLSTLSSSPNLSH